MFVKILVILAVGACLAIALACSRAKQRGGAEGPPLAPEGKDTPNVAALDDDETDDVEARETQRTLATPKGYKCLAVTAFGGPWRALVRRCANRGIRRVCFDCKALGRCSAEFRELEEAGREAASAAVAGTAFGLTALHRTRLRREQPRQ